MREMTLPEGVSTTHLNLDEAEHQLLAARVAGYSTEELVPVDVPP